MPKLIFIALITLFCYGAFAQDDPRIHRVGLSGVYSNDQEQLWGAEFSYQIYLKGIRRLEMNLGWLNGSSWDVTQLIAVYQWRLIRKGGFNFYTGPGLGVGYASYGYGDGSVYGIVAADIGVDYTFKIPLQIGLAYRPEYSLAKEKIGNDINHQIRFAIRLAF